MLELLPIEKLAGLLELVLMSWIREVLTVCKSRLSSLMLT